MNRVLATILVAALSLGAVAADKPTAKVRATKASHVVELNNDDGSPILKSSGVLVLDPATGHTLYSKNADHATPIASITKLMTAMVVVDAKLSLDEALQINNDDLDLVKNSRSRLPTAAAVRQRSRSSKTAAKSAKGFRC